MRESSANSVIVVNEPACESPRAVSTSPTPTELVARLKEVTGATTDEQLARELNVPLRSVAEWKSGKGLRFDTAITLLDRAGWLDTNGAASITRGQMRQAHELAGRLAAVAQDLQKILE